MVPGELSRAQPSIVAHNDGRMSEQISPIPGDDDLDSAERIIAIEETLNQIYADPRLSFAQRESLIREIEGRIESGEFGDEGGDALTALIRTRAT